MQSIARNYLNTDIWRGHHIRTKLIKKETICKSRGNSDSCNHIQTNSNKFIRICCNK
ncbi:hypothetical protein HCH_06185 [Hahella chejuensis KCTC 2396]|uniref:Uncharacterized protein n=1 Tax=Hahella chejuensis (strain KCTC 2396) TaxID=349521 RepID=Q2S945_HAHCH|nr:hypothetical protein HCH_06185 [Hahella chejuensis KCTC 2396]